KEAVAIIARAIQDTQDSVSVGIDAVKYISVEDSECLMKISCTDNCSNENSLSNTGRFIIEFYLKRGQLSFVPEFNEIIDPRFVNELAHQRQEKK
ncbi:MAG: hypothetical protein GY853_00035, partial [PVC group bacterium]|nr:hypothetical protein [PVC group bacterium]